MINALFATYSLAHLLMLIWLIRMMLSDSPPGAPIVACVAAGLTYDNAMIAFGHLIGIGPLLQTLSWPRFALHAAFTPFIMYAAWVMARRAGIPWALNTRATIVLWMLVGTMAAWGIGFDLLGLQIQPACLGDTVRYTSSTPPAEFCTANQVRLPGHGPPVPSIVTVIITLIVGAGLWRAIGWPWLFVASLLMFLAAGAPGAARLPIGNGGEVILQAGLTMTSWRLLRASKEKSG